jgi:hypothetical protein
MVELAASRRGSDRTIAVIVESHPSLCTTRLATRSGARTAYSLENLHCSGLAMATLRT